MVYSASSARALLQGQGDGTAFLVRYLMYGGDRPGRRCTSSRAAASTASSAHDAAAVVLVRLPASR